MRATLLALLLVPFLALSGCLSGGALVGKPSPAFEFVTSEGQVVNETTHLGRYVVLDMMATWCGPCRLEVAHLREVQETFGDDVVILSISVSQADTLQDMEAFEERYGAQWPFALDRDLSMWRAFEGRIIPKLVILDPEGVVAFERHGEVGPAAIARVIDPSRSPSPLVPLATALVGIGLGFLAPLNPYRRAHRDGPGAGPSLAALGIFAALAILAWPFAGIASSRATYGSLVLGGITLLAALWWIRARRKASPPEGGSALQRGSDRAYEMAPHFAGALVIALGSVGAIGFFAPLAGFLGGAAAGLARRERIPGGAREALGLAGLALVGIGLLAYGGRILLVEG